MLDKDSENHRIATRNNPDALVQVNHNLPDTLDMWAEAYFRLEVTTAPSSQKVQRRDLGLFLSFMGQEEAGLKREIWTPRFSRAFVDWLRAELNQDGSRRWGDKTINRITAHLKTWAKWIHKLRPFPLGNPAAKLRSLPVGSGMEVERALTPSERRRLLDAADLLPLIGGRSKDRRRHKSLNRPQHKNYRPWRNRAIIYTLIETGMRRGAVCRLNLAQVDSHRHLLTVQEKGGYLHSYKISREGMAAIHDYLQNERTIDAEVWHSLALFLVPASLAKGNGRLGEWSINRIWQEVCVQAGVKGKTPHSARHAMGRHIMQKTGNPAAVQRQLGHRNVAYSLAYSRITDKELEQVLDER